MKIRLAPSLLVLTLAAWPALVAQDAATSDQSAAPAAAPGAPAPDQSAAPAAAPTHKKKKKTELEIRMSKVSKAYHKLKKQLADPDQNPSSLQLLATMQEALKEATGFTPAKAADLPEDQRPKFIEDYKAGIKGMQDQFSKLRDAIEAGKNDEAVKIAHDIDALEKKDHKAFRRPEKE